MHTSGADTARSTLLIVDDNPAMIQLMARLLTGVGQLRYAKDGPSALAQIRRAPPDLVLLDAEMPGMSGYEVCAELQRDPALAAVPVIFVTGHTGPEFELKGLETGAVDFITKPVSEPLLLARVRTQLRIKRLTDELRAVAATDALTGLLNRRSFDRVLEREWRRCVRAPQPMALVALDVDHFKRFNDRYGHPAGDACLRAVAEVLRETAGRPGDAVARIGGEEFAIVLPQTDRGGATIVAERVMQGLRERALAHEDSPTAGIGSTSLGVACLDADSALWPGASEAAATAIADRADELLRCADQALYAAKAAGRARAWLQDYADLGTPGRPHEIATCTLPPPRVPPAAST
ncbi:diguanylate cyclase [Rubrivivax sp. JA1029]|uniref:GGDEF domain-containing response regulator n=1 Tax=Rubrivivax sp. JA1029 TaxID=2894193 RepID=UPI001E5D0152|nr:diguanylate cyclase [Rubrivivax sp. JA1029]MCC9648448.1 diguanylate cyclase [Rubrivivax sp. JA1029]